MKKLLICCLLLILFGCSDVIIPEQIENATELCSNNGGVSYIMSSGNTLNQKPFTFVVKCNNGGIFNISTRDLIIEE